MKALVDEVKQLNETDKEKMSDAGRAVVNAVLSGHDIVSNVTCTRDHSLSESFPDPRWRQGNPLLDDDHM